MNSGLNSHGTVVRVTEWHAELKLSHLNWGLAVLDQSEVSRPEFNATFSSGFGHGMRPGGIIIVTVGVTVTVTQLAAGRVDSA